MKQTWAGIALCLALQTQAQAQEFVDLRRGAAVAGDAAAGEAKVAVCVACHGPGGNALVPLFPALAAQHRVAAPALIVVGEVVRLHPDLGWFHPAGPNWTWAAREQAMTA